MLIPGQTITVLDPLHSPPNPPLVDHVTDVWAALSAVTEAPTGLDYEQLETLELFFLSLSHQKLTARFKEDETLCGGRRLYEVIRDWQPNRAEITLKWVRPPEWLVEFEGLPSIKSREVDGQAEWEFSDDTKKAWSEVLVILLSEVGRAIKLFQDARDKEGKEAEEEERQAMVTLNTWCRALCHFIIWDEEIVPSLLTKTNMVDSITTNFMPTQDNNCA